MSNLALRILSSIGFVVLILGPLFIGFKIAYTVYAVLGYFTLLEVGRLIKGTGGKFQVLSATVLYLTLIVLVYAWFFEPYYRTDQWVFYCGVIALATFFIEIFRANPQPFQNASTSLVAPIFVASSFLGIGYFIGYRDDLPTLWITISLFALIWVNDSAAYLIGRKIGKHKLYEKLSPNKTIEGSLAGLIFAMLAGVGLSFIDGMPTLPVMMEFSACVVVAGSLGDLFESRMKRTAGVKDSGTFLPGHGGFFDRFDAMMLAIPTAIVFFEIVLPKP